GGESATTNNRMEMMAAIQALEALKRPVRVRIHTDSQYLRNGITQWLPHWKRRGWRKKAGPVKNIDLWQRLEQAAAPHQVEWLWVRGHAGHVENERADLLARRAIAAIRAGPASAGKAWAAPATGAAHGSFEVAWSAAASRLEELHHRFGARYLEGARSLDVERFHDAVVNQHGIALRARAHAVARPVHREADRLGELAVAVGEHHHVVADLLVLAPCVHDEGVVHRQAGDRVDALGLDRLGVVDEARKMLGRAGGREGARQGEDNHLLALEQLIGGYRLHPFAGHGLQGNAGNLVANLDHVGSFREWVKTKR